MNATNSDGATTPERVGLRGWLRGHKRWNEFIRSVLAGLVLAVISQIFAQNSVRVSLESYAWDLVQRTKQDVGAPDPARALPSFLEQSTFVDVDDQSWSDPAWGDGGEPVIAPRKQLNALIKSAAAARPRYIILDILLDRQSGQNADDKDLGALQDTIEEIATKPENAGTKILFARSVRESDRSKGEPHQSDPNKPCGGSLPVLRPSWMDDLIAKNPGRLFDIAPYYAPSADGVVRGWHLWREVCRLVPSEKGKGLEARPTIIMSPQLLIWLLEANPKGALPDSMKAFQAGKVTMVRDDAEHGGGIDAIFRSILAETRGWDGRNPGHMGAVFSYLGSDHHAVAEGGPISPESRIDFRLGSAACAGRCVHMPAVEALKKAKIGKAGGIVIIGQSYAEGRDRHRTPLGDLPGPLIILNSIYSLFETGPIHAPGHMAHYALILVEILVVAGIFTFFLEQVFIAKLVTTVIALALVLVSTVVMARLGVWYEFTAPILGVIGHHYGSDFLEYWNERNGHGAQPSLAAGH